MTNEQLVQLYQTGNQQALNTLIEQNSGIVKKIINRFYIKSNSIDEDDLFQEGCIGLMVAAGKYDFNNFNKAKFTTYSVNWINQKISRFINQKNTNDETSLNTPIGEDGGNEIMVCDLIPDDENMEINCIEKIYQQELNRDLKKKYGNI